MYICFQCSGAVSLVVGILLKLNGTVKHIYNLMQIAYGEGILSNVGTSLIIFGVVVVLVSVFCCGGIFKSETVQRWVSKQLFFTLNIRSVQGIGRQFYKSLYMKLRLKYNIHRKRD